MFTDIHNHMAWDIDDGMQIQEQAELALQNAMQDGIHSIIATPHVVPGVHTKEDHQAMNQRMEELQKLAAGYGIEIYKGSEVFLNHEYLTMIDEKLCDTLNDSRYLLVEFDVRKDMLHNDTAEDMLYELQIRGYVPVIAHVERYFPIELDLERIKYWLAQGYLLQVNRTSILGMHGKACERNAALLLKHGLVHVIASDAHRATGSRVCKFSDVFHYIEKRYGTETAQLLCQKNPEHILRNESLEQLQIGPKGLLQRLFRKG